MNYNVMNCMSQGVIIKEAVSSRILYMNKAMKDMLNITSDRAIETMDEILQSQDMLEFTNEKIQDELKEKNEAYGLVYFKDNHGNILESSFKCTYTDDNNNVILYAFEDSYNVTSEEHLNLVEITEFLPNGVMVMHIEPELSVSYANNEQYKILNLDNSKDEFNKLFKYSIYEEDRDWVMAEIYDNLHNEVDVDIEFRMKGKRNTIKWVRLYGRVRESSNGQKLLYSSLKDLSNRREINDKLHLERILFHKITEISNEIIFRLDLRTNIIHFIGKNNGIFGDNTSLENFPQCFLDLGIVYEDDIPIFLELAEALQQGNHKYIETRHKIQDGSLEWHKAVYTFVKDSDDEPILAIGKLININDQKILQEQAKRDLLTGFYNKIYTEVEVNKLVAISDMNEHVLFIVDLDNFKAINDNLGHHFGDFVLKEVATDIRKCFRKNDILGRIGGDEFIIAMKNSSDVDIASEKATQLCNILQKTYYSNDTSYSISASIGVALCPEDGTNFEDLYKKADKALYASKNFGKNTYTIYNKKSIKTSNSVIPNLNKNPKKRNILLDFEVLDKSFSYLYESEDVPNAVEKVLEYLCNYYKVDRGYIFETSPHQKEDYRNTYQWECDKTAIKGSVTYITKNDFNSLFEKSNDDGIFYANDMSIINNTNTINLIKQDNISAIFLVKSLNNNSSDLFFGLDDCKKKRIWSEKEIKTLFYTSKILFMVISNYNEVRNLKIK
ncbi:MAG: diguanylate cyclase [bacterium]